MIVQAFIHQTLADLRAHVDLWQHHVNSWQRSNFGRFRSEADID